MADDAEQIAPDVPDSVTCPATKDPFVRIFIVAGLLIAMAIWCLTDQRETPDVWTLKNINKIAAYLLNNIGPYVFFPVGALFLIKGVLMMRRVLVADAEGIAYVGKQKIAWSDVTSLDASDFDKKGILRLKHSIGGSEATMVLDGWKLQNFKALVQLVEAKTNNTN